MIRKATKEDIPQLMVYGEHFWTLTPYATTGMQYNPKTVAKVLLDMVENHYVSVYEADGEIVGFIGIILSEFLFNQDYDVGIETFFFVSPDYRGSVGGTLLSKAEEDLKGKVCMLAMSELTTSTEMKEYYEDRGYTLTENTYGKIL